METTFINSLSAIGVPDHELILKPGALVILIKNLSFTDRLVNGTKLIVTGISTFLIEAQVPGAEETVMIPRVAFRFEAGRSGIPITRRQFPLKLAYAVTINKAQGQTLNMVGVDLREDVFSHGQLYVALGRVRSSTTIRLLVSRTDQYGRPYTVNIVNKNLL